MNDKQVAQFCFLPHIRNWTAAFYAVPRDFGRSRCVLQRQCAPQNFVPFSALCPPADMMAQKADDDYKWNLVNVWHGLPEDTYRIRSITGHTVYMTSDKKLAVDPKQAGSNHAVGFDAHPLYKDLSDKHVVESCATPERQVRAPECRCQGVPVDDSQQGQRWLHSSHRGRQAACVAAPAHW